MKQLPIFMNMAGCKVVLVGEGEAADAKRRLIERTGAVCVGPGAHDARLAFVAHRDSNEAIAVAAALKAQGLLVNVVDQPDHCDFTTPAIVDRDPVLIAIGTGGASAGLAKALRQRFENLLPHGLGSLANGLNDAREQLRRRWPDGAERRKAIDDALSEAAILDPLSEIDCGSVAAWLDHPAADSRGGLVTIELQSNDPDDLTVRQARLLGQADHIFHDGRIPSAILNRARADAVRHLAEPPAPPPAGLVVHLRLQSVPDYRQGRV